MMEFAKNMPGDGDYEKMVVIATSGGLGTAYDSEPIAPDPNQFPQGELQYFLKVPKIREVIQCADGLFGRKK